MIPILYSPLVITEGTVPTNYGIGTLTDCLACTVKEERNGAYELTMDYSANGVHADQIVVNGIIKAKPNFTDNPQLFRIYKVGKIISGQFTVYAQHISYDLNGKVATSGDADSCTTACLLLTNNFAGNFTIATDKTLSAHFEITEPSSVKSWLGGKASSILDVFGPGEWHFDNYTATFMANRGADRGIEIRYGKNLTELSQELSIENLVTSIIPYAINPDTEISIAGSPTPTGLTLDVPHDKAINFSQQINWEDATPVTTQLNTLAAAYVSRYGSELINEKNSITLNFVQLSNLQDRVDLCDTVKVYFEALGINATVKCVATVWDVLADRYASCTLGDARTSIVSTIASQQAQLSETPTNSEMSQAIAYKTDKISGNLGGYVINGYDSNGDGYPDENLVLNTPSILTASKVVRMNQAGIGVSNTGYAGPYTNAITGDGINASAITAGVINANLIKAGTISDANGKSEIDMTTGIAKLYELKAIAGFTVITQGDEEPRAQFTQDQWSTKLIMSHNDVTTPDIELVDYSRAGTEYSSFRLSNDGGSTYTVSVMADNDGGHVLLKNANGNNAVSFFADGTFGGNWYLYDTNGASRFHAFVGSVNDDGILDLFDGNDSVTISLVGNDGVIECGAVKPRNQIVSLWTGTLNGTAGNDEAMVPYGPYSAYLVKWRTSTSGYYQTMLIPRIDLQDSIQDTYQFNTESQYYTFYADYVGTTAYFTYRGRTTGSTAHICAIYGIY